MDIQEDGQKWTIRWQTDGDGRQTGEWKDGRAEVRMYPDGRVGRWEGRRTGRWIDKQMDRRTAGQMDEQTEMSTDRRTNGQTDRVTILTIFY
jgi:hypothetical protein